MADYIDGGGNPTDLIDGQGGPADLFDGDPSAVVVPGDPGGGGTDPGDGGTGGGTDPGTPADPDPPFVADSRTVSLESLDGSVVIALNTSAEEILTSGVTGLGVGPVNIETSTTPGMPGSWLDEITELEREVFLPLEFASEESHTAFLARMARLRSVVIPEWSTVDVTQSGTFRLVVSSVRGERLLDVIYKSGLEGKWGGSDAGSQYERFGLVLLAVDPYWRDRNPVTLEFSTGAGSPFLSDDAAYPWPRTISASVAVGDDIEIEVSGEVPVWPLVEVVGPASFADLSWPDAHVQVPNGVPSAKTLLVRTNPRGRSVRLDGVLAWDLIAFDSSVAPLAPGKNIVNASVGTSGVNTGLLMTWTPGYRTAW